MVGTIETLSTLFIGELSLPSKFLKPTVALHTMITNLHNNNGKRASQAEPHHSGAPHKVFSYSKVLSRV